MIPVKEAVATASIIMKDLYPQAQDFRLEQVERAGPYWEVVLSFRLSDTPAFAVALGAPNRLFKTVSIDGDSGELISLRMFKA